MKRLWQRLTGEERGITGLETAIVLIAFVVVASVFAFAVLSTGLLSSEKGKETTISALEQTSATISVRGSVIAVATTTKDSVHQVKFTLTSAGKGAEPVDLSSSGSIVTYTDKNQQVNLATSAWSTSWLIGSSPLVDPNEQVEMTVNLGGLTTLLATSTDFTIQIKPNKGAVVVVNRTTPTEFNTINDLN